MRNLKFLAIIVCMYSCVVTCNATSFTETMVPVNIPMCNYNEISQEEYDRYPILQMFGNNQNPFVNFSHDLKWYGNFVDTLLVDVQKFNDAVFKNHIYDNKPKLAECLKYMFYGIIRTIYNAVSREVITGSYSNNAEYRYFNDYLFNICGQVFMSDKNYININIKGNPYKRKYKTIEEVQTAFEYLKLEVKDLLSEDKNLEYNAKFGKYSNFRYKLAEMYSCMYYMSNTPEKSELLNNMNRYSEELVKGQVRKDNSNSDLNFPADSYVSKYQKQFDNFKKRKLKQTLIKSYNLDDVDKFNKYSVFRDELGKIRSDVINLPNTKQKRELSSNMQNYDIQLMQEQMSDDTDYSDGIDDDDYSDNINEEVSTNKVKTNQFKPNTIRN
ncbi:MAG: hypothetical protein IJU54_02000 [Alphaproteobacteria bacterium]|nr:hypothetical protein [Alphaproteobacteria bacterium]